MPAPIFTKAQIDEAIDLYQSGLSLLKVQVKTGISRLREHQEEA